MIRQCSINEKYKYLGNVCSSDNTKGLCSLKSDGSLLELNQFFIKRSRFIKIYIFDNLRSRAFHSYYYNVI